MASDHLPARESSVGPEYLLPVRLAIDETPARHVCRTSMVHRSTRIGNPTKSEASSIQARLHRCSGHAPCTPLAGIGRSGSRFSHERIGRYRSRLATHAGRHTRTMAPMAMNSDQITIRISAFASAAQIMGERTSSVVVPAGSTVDQAWSGLILRHGDLQSLSSTIAFGVNDQLSGRETVLKDGDRLDLLPPVSGG